MILPVISIKMQLQDLRKKYPEFVYEKFEWKIANGDLVAGFCFAMGEIEFNPKIIIRGVDEAQIKKMGETAITNFVFHLGLAEMPSYWKSACAPKIIIAAGYLDKTQIKFWQKLFKRGMGQFFFENKLLFIVPDFEVRFKKPKNHPQPLKQRFGNKTLVPMGGGKDSLVSWEILRQSGGEAMMFALNPNEPLRQVCAAASGNCAAILRQIDPRLIALKKQGFLNGHTPFSALLSFHSIAVAAFFGCNRVAISQERSSNEGNVCYLGEKINHQYSKSFDFENKFRAYAKKYLAKNIDYFSFLRPLYELQIAALFCRHPKYFSRFLSCNWPFTLASRAAEKIGWCGECPKCLAGFAMLYPFAGTKKTIEIFGKNLFEDKNLSPLMAQLLGEDKLKPFECVGTFAETCAAFYLSLAVAKKETSGNLPALLQIFEQEFLPKYGNMKSKSQKILSSWNNHHNLPKTLENKLKSTLRAPFFVGGLDKN